MKGIAIGDVHIANRRLHNIANDPLFRLHQFPRVADRIYAYCTENEIEEIWILGDLVDDPVLQPEEAHIVHMFIKRLIETGCKIKFILGNHDVSTKSETDDSANRSLVPLLMDYPEIEYMHRKGETIEGVRFEWCNWQPNFSKVDWFDECDVFLSHINILEGRFGQKLDESRFKMALAGDIHMKCNRGKAYSTGAVIQSNAGDAQDGSFVKFEVKDGDFNWDYVDTIVPGEYDFLRVFREDKLPEDYVEQKYDVVIPIEVPEETKGMTEEQVDALFDSDETLESALVDEDDEVANLVKSCMNSVDADDLALSTVIFEEVVIHNFRCIEDRTINLKNLDKLNRITGPIGNGKSSIVSAMDYVFAGKGSPKSKIRFGAKEMQVTVQYSYRGIVHIVSKSGQYISKWIRNGIEQEAGSKKELQELYIEDNPWIQAWKIMYRNQHSAGFLVGMNLNDRVKFMSRLLGFEGIFETHAILKDKLKAASKEMVRLENEQKVAEAIVQNKESEMDDQKIEDVQAEMEQIKTQIEKLKADLDAAVAERSDIQAKMTRAKKKTEAVASVEAARTKLEATEKPKTDVSDTEADLALIKEYNGLKTSSALDRIKTRGEAAREEMNNPPNKCKECGNDIDVPDEWLKSKQAKLDELFKEYAEVEAEVAKRESMKEDFDAATQRINDSKATQAIAVAYSKAEQALKSAEEFLAEYADVDETQDFDADMNSVTERGKTIQVEQEALQNELGKCDARMSEFSKLDKLITDAESKAQAVVDYKPTVDNLERAVFSTSMDGPVLSKTMAAAAQILSDGVITVRTTKISAKKVVPDFNVELMTEYGPVPYDELSGGQLAIVDLYLITRIAKLIGGFDLLILDEVFKFLDQESIINVLDEFKKSDVNKIVMIAHGSSCPQVTRIIES